ncbi:hypothetical protein TRFO_07923 [Tritrichomonas foetus]|uniref:Protein kinase domain-containing protein n=1 Tax=Tritrichomonas foetus TaxID=1144522 RepID=A0A1J4JTI2_9EUKA|nr:hypothetical protein TRFO_07923 [Tritrichomonas foetus]|eukprot:OHT00581.1 hypothetical protein TRFO_07923 [Tritrichomonas foetus]
MTNLSDVICNSNKYKVIREIGNGSYATVFLAEDQEGNQVALKQLNYSLNFEHMLQQEFMREISIMAIQNHMTVIDIINFALPSSEECAFIVMPFMKGGTLESKIDEYIIQPNDNFFSPTDRSKAAFGIAYGMMHIHAQQVIHRDLKTQNILLNDQNEPVITDFGLSKPYRDDIYMSQRCGSPYYIAPEIIDTGNLTPKTDVYSYSIILYRLFFGEYTFSNNSCQSLRPSDIYNKVEKGDRFEIPQGVPPFWENLIKQCWKQNPLKRPTFCDIVKLLIDGENLIPGTNKDAFFDYVQRLVANDDKFLRQMGINIPFSNGNTYQEEEELPEDTEEFSFVEKSNPMMMNDSR